MIKFHSKRLLIRDHDPADLPSHYALLSDSEVMFYLPDIHCTSLDEARQHLQHCIKFSYQRPRKYYFFRMENRFTGEHIGEVGFTVTGERGNAGYFLNKAFWGCGYASEALSAILHFAFIETSVATMMCGCNKQNIRSEKVMKSCDMAHSRHYRTEAGVERVEYCLTSEQWMLRQSKHKL